MSSPNTGKRRMDTDVIKLITNRHEVQFKENASEFLVKFHGPKGTAYEDGIWRIRVDLPDKYPFKSPSIGFTNKIFHPNIDESSGTVCLDVINQNWTALYDLTNIFESFLPQLLTYPNANDPLNGEAAQLYIHKPDEFNKKCKDYVNRFASEACFQRHYDHREANKRVIKQEELDDDKEPAMEQDDDYCSISSMSEFEDDDDDDDDGCMDHMEM